MNIKPSVNLKIFGLNVFFYEILHLYKRKLMPNSILFSGKKGLGKATFAYHIVNYILSINEEFKYNLENFTINPENKSYKLLQNSTHPNLLVVDIDNEKKNIDIAQIRTMITYLNKSNFNNNPRFILIDNIENLNKNSANALLKILEEPNQNVFFLLIHNNQKKILPTLKSRCLTFNINLSFQEVVNVSNLILKKNIFELINTDLVSYYNTPGELIKLISFSIEKKIRLKDYNLNELITLLIDCNYYKKDKYIKELLINFIELYFLKNYDRTIAKNSLLKVYQYFLNKIHNTEKFNLDDESLFLEFKSKLLNG